MTLCERNASNKEKIFLRLFPLISRGTAQGASNEIASVQWAFAVLLSPIIVGYKKKKAEQSPALQTETFRGFQANPSFFDGIASR